MSTQERRVCPPYYGTSTKLILSLHSSRQTETPNSPISSLPPASSELGSIDQFLTSYHHYQYKIFIMTNHQYYYKTRNGIEYDLKLSYREGMNLSRCFILRICYNLINQKLLVRSCNTSKDWLSCWPAMNLRRSPSWSWNRQDLLWNTRERERLDMSRLLEENSALSVGLSRLSPSSTRSLKYFPYKVRTRINDRHTFLSGMS